MGIKNPVIIKGILSEEYMNIIEYSCIHSPWSYVNNITYGEDYKDIQNGYSFSFTEDLPQYWLYQYLIFKTCEKINFNVKKIIRIRKRMTYPNKEKYNIPYQPHVDMEYPHLNLLYYVNDSDGDTFLYNEKYNKKYKKSNQNFSLQQKVKFQKGNILIFDGKQYHSSSLSSTNNRIILNINVSGKFKK